MLNSYFMDKIKLLFRKDKELYLSLYDIMGFYPRNIELYRMALSHKSVHSRNKKGKPMNNERLEFLGDAILDAIVGDIVYRHFPGKREGFLTNTRSKLVQRETLNRLATDMGITRLIFSSGRSFSHNSYMAGNAFEALVGAIYLDRGYDLCMRFMQKRILAQMINIDTVAYQEVNFKSRLIEWTQKNKMQIAFQLIEQRKDEEGNPMFEYAVVVEGVSCASAAGFSKKESQQAASQQALTRIRKEPKFMDRLFAAKKAREAMAEGTASEEKVPTDDAAQAVSDDARSVSATVAKVSPDGVEAMSVSAQSTDEFDLSDISATPKTVTPEEIIAAAEEAAYADEQTATA